MDPLNTRAALVLGRSNFSGPSDGRKTNSTIAHVAVAEDGHTPASRHEIPERNTSQEISF